MVIERICRTFLWTGGVDVTKKALIAWDKLCFPKSAGGLNLLNIHIWNKAALCKMLWNLSRKKDVLWIQWVYSYYGKSGSIWGLCPKQACWIVQKVLKAKKYVEEAGLSEASWNIP